MVKVTKQKPETRTKEILMTMVRHSSLFSQLVGFFHRYKFHSLVKKHQAEKYSKGFKSWDHFVSILFCQLAQAKSLREISGGLACCMGKLRHLGMEKSPSKSWNASRFSSAVGLRFTGDSRRVRSWRSGREWRYAVQRDGYCDETSRDPCQAWLLTWPRWRDVRVGYPRSHTLLFRRTFFSISWNGSRIWYGTMWLYFQSA